MYLVAYDIRSDKIRTKIAHYLEKKGRRIQKSVFVVNANKKSIKYIKKDLERIRHDDGIIHIFSFCKLCQHKSYVIGKPIPDTFYFFD